jgi:hypothetical protein
MKAPSLATLATLFALIGFYGCNKNSPEAHLSTSSTSSGSSVGLRFHDITQASGIHFQHNTGAFGLKFMPETMGSGCAFLDYNNDGYQDIFFVNGRNWAPQEVQQYEKSPLSPTELEVLSPTLAPHQPRRRTLPPQPSRRRTTSALYRNDGNGRFTDVTRSSGLDVEMYGQGVAVGDYNNDGKADLYVTGYGRNYLFQNNTQINTSTSNNANHTAINFPSRIVPRFVEVAQAAGVQDSGWSTSAAWLDYDKDGHLDLFVCRYLLWNPNTDAYSAEGGKGKSYSAPTAYSGLESHLYHNNGNGRFANVSVKVGIQASSVIDFSQRPSSNRQPLSSYFGSSHPATFAL